MTVNKENWYCESIKKYKSSGVCENVNCDGCKLNSCENIERLIKCWAPENKLKPRFISRSSTSDIFLKCDKCKEIFKTTPNRVNNGHWCPRNVCLNDNSFINHHRAKYWVEEKNTIKLKDVTNGSSYRATFHCILCNEDFTRIVKDVVRKENCWCQCYKKKPKALKIKKSDSWFCETLKRNRKTNVCGEICCNGCRKNSFETHEKSKFLIGKIDPITISIGSSTICRFFCDVCNEEFDATPNHVSSGRWCPFCSGKRISIENSFAKHEKSKFWSSHNLKKPENVTLKSHYKAIFDCPTCKHSFKTEVKCVTNGHWCPYCAKQKFCENSKCDTCHKKSFMESHRAEFWSSANSDTPKDVFLNSNEKRLFDCYDCGHTFEMSLNSITQQNRWCNYCSGEYLCENDDCDVCFEKSFASQKRSKDLTSKNTFNPRDVFKSAKINAWFKCSKCKNEFSQSLDNSSQGYGCPNCKNKTECMLLDWLKKNYPNKTILTQMRFAWCKNIKTLPFDFYFEGTNLLIELDGPQHKIQVSNWSLEKIQKRDKIKDQKCLEHGYILLRVNQPDVYNNKNQWDKKLRNEIDKHL